jgi:hypothetical protein
MRLIHGLYLKVGTHIYSGTASDVNVPGITPTVWAGSTDTKVVADVPVGQRVVNIVALTDWDDEAGLCEWLATHEGEEVEVVFSHDPDAATPTYHKVTAIAAAPSLGGAVNAYGEFTLALPCTKPERTTAPVA